MNGSSTSALADPQALLTEALHKVSNLATLPEITSQIITIVEDPRSSAAKLHKIISHDPALVTRIVKIVNSSFYGLPGQIGSVERAIVLLGLNAVKNIAVAASLGQLFRSVKLCEGFTARDLWTHCISVAVVSRHMAQEMKLQIADEAFLAGMIHDIGILISLQVWPDKLRQACEKSRTLGVDFCQAERDIVGVDHQQLGAALAQMWKFPFSCQLVAGQHHQPTQLPKENRLLVALIFTADTICCQANYGFNLTAINQKLDDAKLHEVQIDQALIERTCTNLPEVLAPAKGLF